jgi:hypothetical protein
MAFRVNASTASRSIRARDLLSARFPTLIALCFWFFERFGLRSKFFRQFGQAHRIQIVGSPARKTPRFFGLFSRSRGFSLLRSRPAQG